VTNAPKSGDRRALTGAKWFGAGLLVWLACLPSAATAQTTAACPPAGTPLLYIGDRDFPPYEYLSEQNRPVGFNIEVVQALARELGVPIEIRLLPWADVRHARENGTADLFSAGYVPARSSQFDFLAAITTIRSSMLMRPGRASYPSTGSAVRGLRIAIQDGAPSAAGFDQLPEDERPTIVETSSHRESVALVMARQVDAAAGSGATLRWHALDAGIESPVEIPVNSRPYMLVTRKGCGASMAHVAAAVDRLKHTGLIDQIADHTLAPRAIRFGRREIFSTGAVVLVLVGAGLTWNWTLRRTVRTRTRALSTALGEQQRLTDVIQSNEGRLAFAMDVIGEGVWEWDLETDQIRASTRWAGSFGYRPEEAPTSYATWMAYVHPEDRDRVAAAARAHIAGHTPRFEATYRVPLKGGDWIWVVDRGRIVRRDASGKPTRMVGALKDITMQLAAERALHEAKEAAEATSHAKSAFLATISHEMRTPLNAVIGTATLLEHSPLSDDQRELLRLLKRSGDSLLAVVNDVLDFTKIESGRVELDERAFDLQQTVRDSMSLVEHVARSKELRLETTFAPESACWLHGDDTRLRQILLNLLSNAVKFTERGVVRVDVAVDDCTSERVQLRTAVKDSGIGIPADRVERLFQPFSQVDSSTTRRFGGTGLGLAISQRLAELMGGTIDVKTAEGEGSTFTLRVSFRRAEAPVDAALAELPRDGASAARAAGPSLRLLLAEDNTVNQFVQLRMLRQLGYDCALATTGIELVEALAKAEYDLVLLDVQMPEMDGIEAARELRRRGFSRVRLVALTADVTTETRQACLEAGIDEFLSKPLKLDALAAVLARAEARPAPPAFARSQS
jgi:PAS domain S-box-containing protein